MWKWLGKLFPSHGASRILDSSIPSSRMDLRKATMLRKSPKDLLPNGGRFMDESHGTINPFKNKHKNKSKRTKLSNKTIQIKQAQHLKNSRYLRGWKWCFFSTSHPTIPRPTTQNHRQVRLQSPHWPCWCQIIAPNCSSKGSDQRTRLGFWGKSTIFVVLSFLEI